MQLKQEINAQFPKTTIGILNLGRVQSGLAKSNVLHTCVAVPIYERCSHLNKYY